jgi:hypothetical protein
MLTPIDQPLDKLVDLTPEEMSVLLFSPLANAEPLSSENMKGWIEHFTNKYVVVGGWSRTMPKSCEGRQKAFRTFKTIPLTEIDLLYHDLKDRTGTPGCDSVRRGDQ